ncbi:MAG: hypothetical protein UT86_C0001G0270 [Candidatus Magasanikbacteria bacterium GW2011_GWC2_40_17]|uniref:Nudix hydrolase domain-containing protein n=1 Tax=Candidatus Magasanikbacteria bacterium GW2011_GWA2_42_32 TaxID=1619039 RepID=A0A0G1A9D6_9BACT|nr:MAG: hypothetical protein UT86_C0001G0270 [Candidatus Magasanikbacteria bacterium GW2011_GWC2_40_17]KKS57630.1 MAG: hypothetical protein UV20_C0001G0270 [Candidatus Magasanikbacteria bacterium GW2011_GWA2_42_32]OGH85910.1 MAG: hypothetical protein A2294_00260 [Candidatus Magasanikbacteria bacterium RIFOXYB2_FULL_38_10]
MWKRIKTEIVHQNPWWIYRHDTFEIQGKEEPGEYYYAETPGSVMVVPLLDDGRIGLIKTYRGLFGKWSIEFPGGGVKADGNFEKSAREELQEEAGLGATELINVGEFCPFNGVSTEICKIYLARGLFRVPAENNPQELIELMPRRVDEMEELIKNNQIWDGQALAVWAIVRPYLFREN